MKPAGGRSNHDLAHRRLATRTWFACAPLGGLRESESRFVTVWVRGAHDAIARLFIQFLAIPFIRLIATALVWPTPEIRPRPGRGGESRSVPAGGGLSDWAFSLRRRLFFMIGGALAGWMVIALSHCPAVASPGEPEQPRYRWPVTVYDRDGVSSEE